MRSQRQGKHGMAHMSAYVSANGFDKEAFTAQAMQKAQNRIEMRAQRFEKTINILTPEQRIKFVSLLQEKQK
jgi:Spy/CpxP family protein refolding chaperone